MDEHACNQLLMRANFQFGCMKSKERLTNNVKSFFTGIFLLSSLLDTFSAMLDKFEGMWLFIYFVNGVFLC